MTTTPRLLAEWEPQGAVMLAWPHHGTDWFSRLPQTLPVFEAIALAILHQQHLIISSEDVSQVQNLQRHFDRLCQEQSLPGRALCLPAPSNDTWARDFGPLAVQQGSRVRLLDFTFNGWGGKYPSEKDNAVNSHLAWQQAFGRHRLKKVDWVLEGGSVETDGQGTLLTTRHCLLDPARNGSQNQVQVEQMLRQQLGFEHFLWLDHGNLEGDDTDGHIDTLARFCSPGCIAYVRCDDPSDSHYQDFQAMEAQLKTFRQANSEPYHLVPLPWPEAIFSDDGERLPATYANFLIINGAVLVPVYGVPQDQQALDALAGCFPGRTLVPVNCRSIIAQHGSLHCLTMQLPQGVWGHD
ncbi:MAG: agmatine deiminase family protein [Halomonadaceae bacterium]|nr:MAG: agmatine deiminase family protein [Halomonadaceae bacterium]